MWYIPIFYIHVIHYVCVCVVHARTKSYFLEIFFFCCWLNVLHALVLISVRQNSFAELDHEYIHRKLNNYNISILYLHYHNNFHIYSNFFFNKYHGLNRYIFDCTKRNKRYFEQMRKKTHTIATSGKYIKENESTTDYNIIYIIYFEVKNIFQLQLW